MYGSAFQHPAGRGPHCNIMSQTPRTKFKIITNYLNKYQLSSIKLDDTMNWKL